MPFAYVYLKNLNGDTVKPITDLSAVTLTTANGVLVVGNTIGVENGYVASCAYEALTDPATAANPDSAFIEGGTMFQLIGGYTVTDEIPPITDASHDKVPSEYSVRSAIDALATLGTAMAPGAGIVVEVPEGTTVGTIAVAEGNGIRVATAQQGGVSVKASTVGGLVVDPSGIAVNAGVGIAIDASNKTTVAIKNSGGLVADNNGVAIQAGETLDLTGGTVNVAVAEVSEVLEDSRIDGGTTTVTPVEDRVVTPGNLSDALSVGQAVDVSCAPTSDVGTVAYANNSFLDTITWTASGAHRVAEKDYFGFGTSWQNAFPKYAQGLLYLFICDFSCNTSCSLSHNQDGYVRDVTPYTGSLAANTIRRIAFLFNSDQACVVAEGRSADATWVSTITNCRQYEVTALTDEAIAYLAQLPDPDAFFRSTDVYSIRDKYLIKQDMVCPFVPVISMTNSDLTIAAGLAYQMQITDNNTHTFTADTIPSNGYGRDSYLQLFVNDSATVRFQSPLVLMNPLTPNAGHNITIKWRAGQALAYVDDTYTV